MHDQAGSEVEGSILEQVIDLLEKRLLFTLNGLTSWWRESDAELTRSLGDKDLIASHVAGSGVVFGVRDAPGVIRNQKSGMQDPANGVVDGLAGRVGLVTACYPATSALEISLKFAAPTNIR